MLFSIYYFSLGCANDAPWNRTRFGHLKIRFNRTAADLIGNAYFSLSSVSVGGGEERREEERGARSSELHRRGRIELQCNCAFSSQNDVVFFVLSVSSGRVKKKKKKKPEANSLRIYFRPGEKREHTDTRWGNLSFLKVPLCVKEDA